MARLRHIIITKRRDAKMKWARRLILGDQADDHMLMFNTSFSWHVYGAFDELASQLKKKKVRAWGDKIRNNIKRTRTFPMTAGAVRCLPDLYPHSEGLG